MTRWFDDLPRAHELLRTDALHGTREVLPIVALLETARDVVRQEAAAKAIEIVVVGVRDEVFVDRGRVVAVLAALLGAAIETAPRGGRVAVTGQEIERELVFAVYDSGLPSESSRFDTFTIDAAHAQGGRVWNASLVDGNLALFSVPLHRFDS